jgi:hypothetical protein
LLAELAAKDAEIERVTGMAAEDFRLLTEARAEIERLRKIEAAVHAFCDELQVLAAPPVQEEP